MKKRLVSGSRLLMTLSVSMTMAVTLAVIGSPASAAQPPNAPTLPIEQKYFAPGPWRVSAVQGFGCCDSSGARFDVWYPTDLGAGGFRHPVITWGNGTNARPGQYAYLLSHLATWGFVVVASENVNTGTGQEILDAGRWMTTQNDQASSIFSHVLAPASVGAIGHSQGAAGVLNAMMKSGGLITTAIPIELAAQTFCTSSASCADTRNLSGGSIFLINGSADAMISPSTQLLPWQLAGLQSDSAYYQAAPASVPKAWGTLIGPDHNDVQGQPGCAQASVPCVNGVYGYLGYLTAWMMDRLQGDSYAHQAFVNGSGEFFHETTNWSNQASTVAR